MARSPLPRRYAVGAALALGICAWLIVSGVVIVDVLRVTATPTSQPTARPVAIRRTEVPTVTSMPTSTAAPIPTAASARPTPMIDEATPDAVGITDFSSAATADATQAGCVPPEGWVAYTVEPGDTLFGFAFGSKGQIDVAAIMAANCLTGKLLAIGQTVFLPPGVAENSPKVDDSPAASSGGAPDGAPGGALPAGLSRTAACPCMLVIRPGWRLEQIAAAVDGAPVAFNGRDFLATTAPGAPVPGLDILRSRPAGKSLEGYMLPGTYTLDNNTSAVQFRDMALNAFAASVGGKLLSDSAARGLTFWQVMVLASIVQRELFSATEQRLIASVFYNRLAANKGLAATVSLQYALGRSGNWWPRIVGSAINTDSPYNTNLYPGLPPSPIASPGLDAIRAAVYPEQTEYQYFAGKCGGGGNFYARTFEEFKQGLKCGS